MQTLRVIIEIAVDEMDTDARQAKAAIGNVKVNDDASLFIGDSEFLVVSASLD